MTDTTVSRPKLTAQIAILALLPFSLGYFLSYLYRAVNAVVAPDLVRDIGVDAAGLGLLTAAYLLAFALFQLPLGLLLDRYGPRRVQAVLVASAALGSVLFAIGESVYTLTAARALIGMGFAGGLMSGFKAVVLWVPEERRALANACVMSLGALGLLVATVPMEYAVQAIGWRAVFWWLAGITAVVAAIIFLVVPKTHDGPIGAGETFAASVSSLVSILKSRWAGMKADSRSRFASRSFSRRYSRRPDGRLASPSRAMGWRGCRACPSPRSISCSWTARCRT